MGGEQAAPPGRGGGGDSARVEGAALALVADGPMPVAEFRRRLESCALRREARAAFATLLADGRLVRTEEHKGSAGPHSVSLRQRDGTCGRGRTVAGLKVGVES